MKFDVNIQGSKGLTTETSLKFQQVLSNDTIGSKIDFVIEKLLQFLRKSVLKS